MDNKLVEAYRFFKENSGYIVGESSACALRTAKAEQALHKGLEEESLRLRWECDTDFIVEDNFDYPKADMEKLQEQVRNGALVVEGIILEKKVPVCSICGRGPDWEIVDSLWGIVHDGTARSQRLYEAEMSHNLAL